MFLLLRCFSVVIVPTVSPANLPPPWRLYVCLASSNAPASSPSQTPLPPFPPHVRCLIPSTGQAHLRPAQAEGGRDEGEAQGRNGCRRVGCAGVAFILGRQPQPQLHYRDTVEHFVVCTFSSVRSGEGCFFARRL